MDRRGRDELFSALKGAPASSILEALGWKPISYGALLQSGESVHEITSGKADDLIIFDPKDRENLNEDDLRKRLDALQAGSGAAIDLLEQFKGRGSPMTQPLYGGGGHEEPIAMPPKFDAPKGFPKPTPQTLDKK